MLLIRTQWICISLLHYTSVTVRINTYCAYTHLSLEHGMSIEDSTLINQGLTLGFYTPLEYAAYTGLHKIVKLLISYGANVNSDRGYSLRQSVSNCDDNMTSILISAGADVNLYPPQNYIAPINSAVLKGSAHAVGMLLSAGAQLTRYTHEYARNTPIDRESKLKLLGLV